MSVYVCVCPRPTVSEMLQVWLVVWNLDKKQKKKSHRTIKFADLRKCEVIIISINTKVIVYGVQIVLSEEIFVTILHLLQCEEKIVPV